MDEERRRALTATEDRGGSPGICKVAACRLANFNNWLSHLT